MPITLLWAVDVYGRVYSLSTAGQRWERADDMLLELKRVTAGKGRCWGIGCDHHVYLNMMPSETPIRYREETYENQRWNPVDGFTDTLLPTDRWPWSDVMGMNPQQLHSFQLPSLSWEWEGDWYVDQSCGGEPSQTGGWEYAVDFPANFSPDKKWNSCVRRRRWIRYRRYIAQGTWEKIPLDNPRKPPLPLSDISCGGWEMSDQSGRYPYLWGVSQQGQVWFREGIHPRVPEGSSWEEVEVPKEVAQLSAGPGDLLWALLWDGNLLVRMGLSLDSPTGTSWVEVESPAKEVEALHVAVGVSVVWVVTKDYKVWAVGEDRGLYFRMGVTSSEPSGSGWIPVSAQWGKSKEVVQPRDNCEFSGQLTEASRGSVLSCTDSDSELYPPDPQNSTNDTPVPEAAAPSVVPLGGADSLTPPPEAEDAPVASQQDAPKPFIPASDSFINSLVSDRGKTSASQPTIAEMSQEEVEETPPAQILPTSGAAGHDVPWMNVDLEGAGAARSALATGPSLADGSAAATYALGTLETFQAVGEEDGPVWTWISGGGCDVDASSQISWLSPTVQSAAWSGQQQQQQEHREEISKKPVERSNSVWVRKGVLRWWRDWKPQRWVDVGVALEQSTKCDGRKDSILFVYYTQYDEKKVSEWAVDYNIPGGTDKEGWQFAADFPVKCKITSRGPWQQVPPIPLSDISLMPCLAQSRMEQVPVWALSVKGDVLCRLGVSPQNPAGSSWLHVGTDQPFKSISIGGANQVWAIAKDGAVFYRGSVSPQKPAGECWYHIPSPPRQTLRQLSVGRTSVFAVDENSNLWYRQGLAPSYPQGSAWELISNNVTKVSVGPLDQVWIVADGVPGFPAETVGAVCHRLGVGPVQPKGQSWDYGIGFQITDSIAVHENLYIKTSLQLYNPVQPQRRRMACKR
ncbi:hypothetical protein F2P81_014926 [Scophthalmus maximus]|uniref:Peroxin/Ferlin domain-containing protein n=1 Tax=Scophthalmus maximus TaxID=52904 RepID=A0A6A4SBT5_SCOMX|nr:hypothetical protein F2P81_014926 [Scophthalmus maximus]